MSTTIRNPRVYAPGANITAEATAAITARRFVRISGNRAAAGNLSVAHASAGGRAFGVAKNDAAIGDLLGVARDGVCLVTTGGAIAAGADVGVGADGKAVAWTTGVVVGHAINGAASGADAEIALF